MNSLNLHAPLAPVKGAPQSSPQWERSAVPAALSLADFAPPAPDRRARGNRAVAMIAAGGVQLLIILALMHGTFSNAPVNAPPPLEVSILPETNEPPPPPPPLKPTLMTPVVAMNMPQAPQIYEPPPLVAMPPSPQAITTAAVPVSNDGDKADRVQDFQMKLLRHLQRHKRYPASARAKREQGVVYVRFSMDRRGNVLSAVLEKRSRFADLDAEGVALLTRAQPLPIPPAEVPGDPLEMIVPVEFSLK